MKKLRTLVLCGGPGVEREVSLASGANVHRALADAGYDARLCDVADDDDVRRLEGDAALVMLHGEFGEDGRVQRVLDAMRLPYAGSGAEASALAIDKQATKNVLARAGVPVAPGIKLSDADRWRGADGARDLAAVLDAAGLACPLVVKPNARGSSVGVTLAREAAALPAALEKAFAVDDAVLIETCLDGREVTVGWLDGRALPVIALAPANGGFYDYDAKYVSEETGYECPARLPEDVTRALQHHADAACRAVGARDLARVDFFVTPDDEVFALEVNTAPGFTTHSLLPMAAAAAGMPFAELCGWLVERAAARWTERD